MRTIWKYELEIADIQKIELPSEAVIVSVGVQGDTIVLYAIVHPDRTAKRTAIIYVVGTGNPLVADATRFIGTVQWSHGLVWHIFEGEGEIWKSDDA